MKSERFRPLIRIIIGFIAIFILLLLERIGILYQTNGENLAILDKDKVVNVKKCENEKTCLLIMDSDSPASVNAYEQYSQILVDMRVETDVWDIAEKNFEADTFNQDKENYKTLVFCINDYDSFGENILAITSWVKEGGGALIGIAPAKSGTFNMIQSKLGIAESGDDYCMVENFWSSEDFMLGADYSYRVEDPYESALSVQLTESTKVYAKEGESGVPLVWSSDYGDGRFVFCNFSYMSKAYRGIYSSAYSLLEKVFVYPVINASTFYIDDFPSPVPMGNGEYIQRDYGMGTADFYSSVWWPDMLSLGNKHNIRYTGLIIETYDDNTKGELEPNKSTADYYYYGNMLLNQGGELGFHGYNHQPLCGPDYVYEDDLGYNVWESSDEMYKAIKELTTFSKGIFPSATMSVYVPPSDVLSLEGRALLGSSFPQIRTIASIYFEGPDAYAQEYTVSEDGVVETPRIVSSCNIDDYMKFAAFSELNFHFVTSHFMHPDDLLDEDRGAELGWETLKGGLDEYMTWIDEAAPSIRHVTGSGMAGAVQRFVNLVPDYVIRDNDVQISCSGLIDSAYCLVRCTDGEITEAYGGNLTKLNDTLYLLEIDSEKVTLTRRK